MIKYSSKGFTDCYLLKCMKQGETMKTYVNLPEQVTKPSCVVKFSLFLQSNYFRVVS